MFKVFALAWWLILAVCVSSVELLDRCSGLKRCACGALSRQTAPINVGLVHSDCWKDSEMTVIQWCSLEKLWCECVRKTRLDWKRASG